MSCEQHQATGTCPTCEFGTFTRNAYWMGKLMLPRDFIDEQRYFMDKLRHHNVHLHGWGVVCGLAVAPHEKEACQDRFIAVEPGVAVDCCGHDIVVHEKEYIDLSLVPEIVALREKGDKAKHTLQVCIRYRECPTEDVPVIYDDCGCETDRCAPNRILESYELQILLDPEQANAAADPMSCKDLWKDRARACNTCDTENCVVLATIRDYVVDQPVTAASIDNDTDRKLLPSNQTIKEVIDCLIRNGGTGGAGAPGKDGLGIDLVEPTFIDCDATPAAPTLVQVGGKRVLRIEIPKGCDGMPGANGLGIDQVEPTFIDCKTTPTAPTLVVVNGKRVLRIQIPKGCDGSDGESGGPGLDWDLPHICDISWEHGRTVKVSALGNLAEAGLVVAFDTKIIRDDLNVDTIQVLVGQTNKKTGVLCWCELDLGRAISHGRLGEACKISSGFTATSNAPEVSALRIGLAPMAKYFSTAEGDVRVRIRINGDFIRGRHKKTDELRALDADHLPKLDPPSLHIAPASGTPEWMRPGDRRFSGDGVEGGTFESWFTISK